MPTGTDSQRYEGALRVSETIAACRACHKPEGLARALANCLGEFLNFDRLYLAVLKENSGEIESFVWGKGAISLQPLPVEELPPWEAFDRQDPVYIPDWNTEQRFPQVKAWAITKGVKLGSTIDVPLTTPNRRLGMFGITSDTVRSYSRDDVSFLGLIGRVVAFAVDDSLNLCTLSTFPRARVKKASLFKKRPSSLLLRRQCELWKV